MSGREVQWTHEWEGAELHMDGGGSFHTDEQVTCDKSERSSM